MQLIRALCSNARAANTSDSIINKPESKLWPIAHVANKPQRNAFDFLATIPGRPERFRGDPLLV
eukprot:6212951-Pleurochrysis_carterae.AAC.1